MKVPSIKVLMSSSGGIVEEGLSLYGFIRSLPVDITIHNIGSVDSISLAVYLGAARRLANPDATFVMHDFIFPQPVPVYNRHQAADISVALTGARQKLVNILKSRAKMNDEQYQALRYLEEATIKTSGEAQQIGIVHEIAEATAADGELFNVEYRSHEVRSRA
ncbi:MAG TPA: ATP-dependent Clp protease proteolytic subunit [Nitrospira sp.]|nr:ATP-dependent Clp protease proteolytic subunit [Nitrospira sp.]